MKKDKLIITGSKGRIGSVLCEHFKAKYEIIEIDRILTEKTNCFRLDIFDFETLKNAVELIGPAKCIIHLVTSPITNSGWNEILKNNIIGTRNIYECARLFNIPKIILASTGQITGVNKQSPPKQKQRFLSSKISVDSPVKPIDDYATSKVFAETLARQYYEQHGIHSICLRIGFFCKQETTSQIQNSYLKSIWISHRDMIQLFDKSLQTNTGFGIYFGVSKNKYRFFDLSKARKEIGFRPKDGL